MAWATNSNLSDGLALGEAVPRRLQFWEERYAEKLRVTTAGGVLAGHATERHLFLGGARPKGSALVAPELEGKDAKNTNCSLSPLIQVAGTIGSPSSEAAWRPSLVLCATV